MAWTSACCGIVKLLKNVVALMGNSGVDDNNDCFDYDRDYIGRDFRRIPTGMSSACHRSHELITSTATFWAGVTKCKPLGFDDCASNVEKFTYSSVEADLSQFDFFFNRAPRLNRPNIDLNISAMKVHLPPEVTRRQPPRMLHRCGNNSETLKTDI